MHPVVVVHVHQEGQWLSEDDAGPHNHVANLTPHNLQGSKDTQWNLCVWGVWVSGRGGYAWYLRTSKLDYHITLTCLSHDLTCEIIATKAQGRSIKRGILTKY